MCWTALPGHKNTSEEWDGYDDDDHWYTSWRKVVKGWFAYGPRDVHWYHRLRHTPGVLFAFFGDGYSRWENDYFAMRSLPDSVWFYFPPQKGAYLSRVQYWTKWHVALHWPLFFTCHFGNWQFYVGIKRDDDIVYWLALYLGRKWK